jgi:hypothetical protein
MWDTIGVAMLLPTLIDHLDANHTLPLAELQRLAGVPTTNDADRCERTNQTPMLW